VASNQRWHFKTVAHAHKRRALHPRGTSTRTAAADEHLIIENFN
jgi:hypothetical protein